MDFNQLILPTNFDDCFSVEEQILWLLVNKSNLLEAGDNITIVPQADGKLKISASGGGSVGGHTYRIIKVGEPSTGNIAEYYLQDVNTSQQSGARIEIPEVEDGFSPIATVTPTALGATISIEDKNGTTTANIRNGVDGENGSDGSDGFSPTASVTPSLSGATISITDKNGTTTANITNGTDGSDGSDGSDGFSPIATVTQTSSGAVISITDANGSSSATITDGQDGQDGVTPEITANATVQNTTGTPSCQVVRSGTDAQPTFTFNFTGIKGEQGPQGVPGSGADGVGISNITLQEETAAGNVYLITLSNNQTYTFTAPRGPQGIQGSSGSPGQNGSDGSDGFSPLATVTPTSSGATISITDENGTTTANITNGTNGSDGSDGADGFSPTATVTQTASGATISITDENGTTTANITNGTDGSDGSDGSDGFSPTATVTQTASGASISITDKNGTTTANVTNGVDGQQGPAGPGVAQGGSTGQVLAKASGTNYDTAWETIYQVPTNGTSGQFLRKTGSGATDYAWQTVASAESQVV